jgi:hypothetical protein
MLTQEEARGIIEQAEAHLIDLEHRGYTARMYREAIDEATLKEGEVPKLTKAQAAMVWGVVSGPVEDLAIVDSVGPLNMSGVRECLQEMRRGLGALTEEEGADE